MASGRPVFFSWNLDEMKNNPRPTFFNFNSISLKKVLTTFCFAEKKTKMFLFLKVPRKEKLSIISSPNVRCMVTSEKEEKFRAEMLRFPRPHQIFRQMFCFFLHRLLSFFSAMYINLLSAEKIDGNISLYWIEKEFFSVFLPFRFLCHDKYFYEDFITTHYRGRIYVEMGLIPNL